MKALIVASLLAFCLLGWMAAPAAAQVVGPLCLRIVEFGEIAQVFALPTGGGQMIVTGKSLTFGDAYTGAGYLEGTDFAFTLATGLLPAVLEGGLNLNTGQGQGSITFVDTSEIQNLTYAIFSPPCVLP
jgi:opacity protein-like surface antigen